MSLLAMYVMTSLASVSAYNPMQEPVFRSRVSVAQCRSTCLEPDQTCTGPQCLACWDQCLRYIAESETGCQERACGAGCQTACGFYNNQNSIPTRRSYRSRSALAFSTPPSISRCNLSWGRLGFSANSLKERSARTFADPTVHLVLGRDRAEKWYEVNQTETLKTIIAHHTLAKLEELLVVAVGPHGVLGSAKVPVVESQLVSCALDRETPQLGSKATFNLALESLKTEGGLTKATLSWNAPELQHNLDSATRFLVKWQQVPQGFISGNLYTNSSSVSLSLVPDSTVVVEVEVLGAAGVSSSQLFINTHTQAEIVFNPALAVAIVSLVFSLIAIVLCIVRFIKVQQPQPLQQQQSNNNSKLVSVVVPSVSSPHYNNLKEVNIVRDKLSNIKDQNTEKPSEQIFTKQFE